LVLGSLEVDLLAQRRWTTMAEKLKVDDLMKLVAEKEALEKRTQEAINTLNTALNKLGFPVVPLEAQVRPSRRRRSMPAKAEAKPAPKRGRRARKTEEAGQSM